MRTIAHISDLHFGRHDPRIAQDLLHSIAESRCDLVAISGDFTQRARQIEFEAARRFVDRIPQPKLLVPGNHDVPLFNLLGRMLAPWTKYDRYIAPAGLPDCQYDDAEIAVLGLNTARRLTRKNGRVSHTQLARIGAAFGRMPRALFKVLVTHHPLGIPLAVSPEHATLELAGRSERALMAVASAGVHLLLSGHHHRALGGDSPTQVGGGGSVLVLHAGTAISTRTREAEGNSYNLLRIAAPRVEASVMAWTPNGFRPLREVSYVLNNDRWRAS